LGGAEGSSQFPGFDGIRLIAAVSVVFSHAFLIAEGTEENEPLSHLLGPGNIVGLYGVFTFFIISGFLLTRSLAANPDLIRFSINRVLRIYPGFVFCTVLTALLFGSLLTESDC
jgi:peptidoglycan/LPS O-acetylase OafA/YrhL